MQPKSQVAKILLIVSIIVLVKIGPSLANDIPKSNDTFSTYLTDAVGDTLFLKPVTKAEIILEWKTRLDTSSRTLFVREGGREGGCVSGCPRRVELRNNVGLLLNVELRNYVISRQIVI